MSGLSIKPKRPKIRRRGGRLLVNCPEGDRYVYMPFEGVKNLRVVEARDGDERHFVVMSGALLSNR